MPFLLFVQCQILKLPGSQQRLQSLDSYKFIFHILVNQNRFQSVISKIGKISKENKELVIEKLYQDTFYDFYINYNFVYDDFEKVEHYVRKLCQNIVSENMLKY